jgi:hypothetical protein
VDEIFPKKFKAEWGASWRFWCSKLALRHIHQYAQPKVIGGAEIALN